MAAFTYVAIYKGETFPLQPGKGYDHGEAAMAEIVFTFVLCFVVLSVATSKDASSQMFGLAIGSCVTVGGNFVEAHGHEAFLDAYADHAALASLQSAGAAAMRS